MQHYPPRNAPIEKPRERTSFRRQLIAASVGAAIGFFTSGTIAVFQADQQAKERLTERQVAAVKVFTQALADVEVVIAEEVELGESLDALRQRGEAILVQAPSKERSELISKLEADDATSNSQRLKLITHWAQVEGSLRSAHIGLRGVFAHVPDLPLPSIDTSFQRGSYQKRLEGENERLQERITTWTGYRDATDQGKRVLAPVVAQQLELAEGLLRASGH